jgi:hypothetical protein
VNEDEAKAVAAAAAQCVTWGGWRRWGPVMRYGRLFTPGTDVGGGAYPMKPDYAGRNAYPRAADSGLLYAEGYACRPRGMRIPVNWAWCLDGETVVDPGSSQPGTAYFGVALRSGYVRRVHEAQRDDDGSDGFTWAFTRHEQENPPLDPAADIVLDLGRDIPSSVRDWALTSERHPGRAGQPPAWVLDELLRFGGQRPPDPPDPWLHYLGFPPAGQRAPDTGAGPQRAREAAPSGTPLPVPYAWYLVRLADWFDSGMALQCSGRTGGVFADDGTVLGKIRDGDSLDTLIRMAEEHRPQCEWAVSPGDERGHPEPTGQKHAGVHLKWVTGPRAERSFAVLNRLDYNVWDAWLHPAHREGQAVGEEPPVRLTRNGVSYEMALTAAFRAMGEEMPEEFAGVYLPFELPAEERAPSSAPLPMSYARYLIRRSGGFGSGLQLHCSGRTGSVNSDNGVILEEPVQDGDSLDTLIRMAGEHRPRCEWAVCPADERERPELTVEKRAEVHLKWRMGYQAEKDFAVLHRLDHKVWDAWLHPLHLEGHRVIREPPVLLTGNGVSYEMALAAVFRAMGEEMPEKFGVFYLYDRPKPDPPGA